MDKQIEFDVAGERFAFPYEAVVTMAENLRAIAPIDNAIPMADMLEQRLVDATDGPVVLTEDYALTIFDMLDHWGIGPWREPAHRMLGAINAALDANTLPLGVGDPRG